MFVGSLPKAPSTLFIQSPSAFATPSRKSPSHKSHERQLSLDWVDCGYHVAVTGSVWLLRGLYGCYRVYMAVTGSTWLLRDLHGCYGVYIAVTGPTSSLCWDNCFMWLLSLATFVQEMFRLLKWYGDRMMSWKAYHLPRCYGSMWLLQSLHGCYGVYIPLFFFVVENFLMWLRWDIFTWRCDRVLSIRCTGDAPAIEVNS